MNYVYYMYNNVKYFYNSMNSATLSGAIDVIVVEQPDGTLLSTPFHVRFGKYGVFNYEDKYVDIEINNEEIDLKMKLGENGVAFFFDKISEEQRLDLVNIGTALPDQLGIGRSEEAKSGDQVPKIKQQNRPGVQPAQPSQNSRVSIKRTPRNNNAASESMMKQKQNSETSSSNSSSDESGSRGASPAQQLQQAVQQVLQEKNRKQPQQLQAVQQQRQKKALLPFSSSIYSCRKNRSLPDLSNLWTAQEKREEAAADADDEPQQEEEERNVPGTAEEGTKARKKKFRGHFRKATFGTIDMDKLRGVGKTATADSLKNNATASSTPLSTLPSNNRKMLLLQHSMSASCPLKNLPEAENVSENKSSNSSGNTGPVEHLQLRTLSSLSPSSDEEGHEDEEAGDKGLQMNTPVVQQQQLTPHPFTSSDIADGALSDSELDRHRNQPQMNDTEWKWGEIPKSTKPKEGADGNGEEGSAAKKSRWNWFRWSRRHEDMNGGAPVEGGAGAKEEKGLYLQDLGGDPAKLEKYFGGKQSGPLSISSNISNVDSGNCVSPLGNSPCNPSPLNLNLSEELAVDDPNSTMRTAKSHSIEQQTPTAETAASLSQNGPNVVENKPSSNDQHQQPRARLDSGQSEASTATDFNLSDDEASLVTAITISAGGTGTGRRVTLEKAVKYKRSLRLTSDQLKLLKLDYGSNDARFSITTKLQGTAWCCCHIYLLRWSDKLVISDVDGTITKSDVLGHVIPAIGGTWAHSGVAELYTRIKNNGYQMVYLSSRAIGQSHYTKTYLQSIAQGSKTLPDGPVLLSPTSVLMAFRKEVIERKPEEFKIACLADLKSLFPEERRPFFAGFGNRETDVKSYRAVGIPLERILIIDPAGMLRRADKIGYISDYATMAMDTVDYIFPPIPLGPADPDVQMEFGEFNTWRPKFQDQLVDEELEAYEARRKQRREADERAASEERKKKGTSVVRRKGNK